MTPGPTVALHVVTHQETGTLHHVELWVPDLPRAIGEWGWLRPPSPARNTTG